MTEAWTDGRHVLRPLRPWSPAVQELLRWLEAHRLPLVPRLVEVTVDSEKLTLLPGDAVKRPWPRSVAANGWMHQVGRWLRAFHQAGQGLRLPEGAAFAWGPAAPGPGDVVSHGDFGPWNLLQQDGRLTGVIDWDFACFAPPLDDLAEAALEMGPLRPNREMLPPGSGRGLILERLGALCAGYGAHTPRELIAHLPQLVERRVAEMRARAEQGVPLFTDMVEHGTDDDLLEDLAHVRATF